MKTAMENINNALRPCTSIFHSWKYRDHSGALLFTTKTKENLTQGRGIGNDLVGTSFPCYALRPQFCVFGPSRLSNSADLGPYLTRQKGISFDRPKSRRCLAGNLVEWACNTNPRINGQFSVENKPTRAVAVAV